MEKRYKYKSNKRNDLRAVSSNHQVQENVSSRGSRRHGVTAGMTNANINPRTTAISRNGLNLSRNPILTAHKSPTHWGRNSPGSTRRGGLTEKARRGAILISADQGIIITAIDSAINAEMAIQADRPRLEVERATHHLGPRGSGHIGADTAQRVDRLSDIEGGGVSLRGPGSGTKRREAHRESPKILVPWRSKDSKASEATVEHFSLLLGDQITICGGGHFHI